MDTPQRTNQIEVDIEIIIQFVNTASGLTLLSANTNEIKIRQNIDGKVLAISCHFIEGIIERSDADNNHFLQVNLDSGRKLLLTEKLIGFKPCDNYGLNMDHLPKVVTTPDLVGVLEALEDSFSNQEVTDEIESLRRLYFSVLDGAERIGFDLTSEKQWIQQLHSPTTKASA